MSTAAAHYAAFYREARDGGEVWTVRDDDGFPAPETTSGARAMPFWSRRSRVERIVAAAPAYAAFDIVTVPLPEFRSRWLPGLERDGLLVGINWSGESATGYDVAPLAVMKTLAGLDKMKMPKEP